MITKDSALAIVRDATLKAQLVEILRCAEINCDNVLKIGPTFAKTVKWQIQQALDMLGEELATERVGMTQ